MECFHDFCLACDRESLNGPYCSEYCKMLDFEKSTSTTTLASTTFQSYQQSRYQPPSRPSFASNSSNAYVLPPAYQFPSRNTMTGYSQPTQAGHDRSKSSYFMRCTTQPQTQETESRQRSVTPSSSRSSLASNISNDSSMSERARQQLQEYFDLFDRSRRAKRRPSLW